MDRKDYGGETDVLEKKQKKSVTPKRWILESSGQEEIYGEGEDQVPFSLCDRAVTEKQAMGAAGEAVGVYVYVCAERRRWIDHVRPWTEDQQGCLGWYWVAVPFQAISAEHWERSD